MDEGITQRPAQTFRQGVVGLSVWQREGQHGPYFEFTVSRSYKKSDDEAGYSHSFRPDNINALRAVLDEAESWLQSRNGEPQLPT